MSDAVATAAPDSAKRASWSSLLRIVRAPLAILVIAAVALLLPPQTADMLAALGDGRSSISPTIRFHVALALLSLSAWYWARALLAAHFDVPDTTEARNILDQPWPVDLNAGRRPVDRQAYELVPRLMFVLAVALGLGLILRTGAWQNLVYLLLWGVPLFFAVYYRKALLDRVLHCFGLHARFAEKRERERGTGIPTTSDLCLWTRNVPHLFLLLIRRAPWPNRVSHVMILLSLVLLVWGTLDAFVPWSRLSPNLRYPGLPALVARTFPGPAAALFGMAVLIAPLSIATFLVDGLNISFLLRGLRMLRRPPVITVLLAWVLLAPTLFSLHTVRIVTPSDQNVAPRERHDLAEFFKQWVAACAPGDDKIRPVIVAISGGASRAAVWAERVLWEVEDAGGDPGPRIFAVSSVSGGSLGVAAYMASLGTLKGDTGCRDIAQRKRQMRLLTNHELSEDAVGPLLAGALLVDIPRALFTPLPQIVRSLSRTDPRGGDRAEALERAFEYLWRKTWRNLPLKSDIVEPKGFDQPYLSLFYEGKEIRPGMPLWIANGTDMETGSRLVTVPFDPHAIWPFPATTDVLAALGADVPISTAINNTARFPFLEPAGELMAYIARGDRTLPPISERRQPDGTAREIIDGGYFDNEGLQTALDLAEWLRREGPTHANGRIVEPIIVEATGDGDVVPSETIVRCDVRADDPAAVADTRRPFQLLAPVMGLYNVRGGHGAVLLREARAMYCPGETTPFYRCDIPRGLPVRCIALDSAHQRFFHFYLPAQGANPVPLNWVLSDSMARFIWDGAMQAGGNPREARTMREAFASVRPGR